MEKVSYIVDELNNKNRLDVFIEAKHNLFSRSHYKKQIEDGQVLVNGKVVTKAGTKLNVNDEVTLQIIEPKQIDLTPQDIKLDIVYEDDDLAVINKPQGLVVHPASGNLDNTLVNALLYSIKNLSGINGEIRPGIVHRLDKDTSGLLLIAKNDNSHISLSKQIQEKSCKRYYLALVQGNVKQDSGIITSYISRDEKNRLKMAVNQSGKGKYAETHYKVLKRFNGYTLVECELKTGRTHQIRVHMLSINHPVVGDELYNSTKSKFNLKGQLLHAYKIIFTHPTTNEEMMFETKLPDYFENVLNILQINS